MNAHRLPAGLLVLGLVSPTALVAEDGRFVVGRRGHVLVPVSIDGQAPKPFVLDTGASQTVLDPGEFPTLPGASHEAADRTVVGHGARGNVEARATRVNSIALWHMEQQDQQATLMEVARLTPGREPDFAGVLGVPFLSQYRIDLDYPRRQLRLDAIGGELPACDICEPDAAIPLKQLIGGLPAVTVTLNGKSMTALFDTGAAHTILNEAAAAQLGLSGPVDDEATVEVEIGLGREPAIRHDVRRIKLPVFETLRLDAVPALILGIDYLGRGRTVLDLARDTVWFNAASN